MKNLATGILVFLIAALAVLSQVSAIAGVPFLTYVYSNSMEPQIRVHDAFLIWPTRDYEVGDIVTFRPQSLPAQFVTHRIIEKTDMGFATKGDNAPYRDQSVGEPFISEDQIVGEVVSLAGQPLILPRLGSLSAAAQNGLGKFSSILATLLMSLGIASLLWGKLAPRLKRKSRHRWRLVHLYRIVGLASAALILISISLSAQVSQVRFLVSENPGDTPNRLMVNQPGELTLTVHNRGLWPAWLAVEGLDDTTAQRSSHIIWPLGQETVTLTVPAQDAVGWYQRYIRVNQYPVLFPENFLEWGHHISPLLAALMTGAVFFFWYLLWIAGISRLPGLEKWMPLKSFRDKVSARRWRKLRLKLLGRPGRSS